MQIFADVFLAPVMYESGVTTAEGAIPFVFV